MINLPEKTFVDKFIPKTAFYTKVNMATSIKNEFVEYIEKIVWKNKLSEDTIGVTNTEDVEEIHIFEIVLKNKYIPKNAIKTILRYIQYPVLIKLKYKEEFCYTIGLYENKKIQNCYFSNWNEQINFNFAGINLKIVYEKIVKSILNELDNDSNLGIIIELNNKISVLEKEIKQIQGKLKTEKQFNRKMDLNKLLNAKVKELEVIKNG